MNKKIALSIGSILASVALLGGTTFALFNSDANNVGNTFGAGTLTLEINDHNLNTSTLLFSIANAKPGDITPDQSLVLKNSGTVDATSVKLASITRSSTPVNPDIASKLIVTLKDATNSAVINQAPMDSNSWNNLNLFPLAGGATHSYLVNITFDSTADNTYQGASTTFAFNFHAEQ